MVGHLKVGDQRPRVQYYADGVQRAFVFPFPIFHGTDLRVFVDGGLIVGGYQVGGAGEDEGGSVTFWEAPALDRIVTIERRRPIARATDFLQGGDLRADSFNDEFDHQTMVAQQLAEDLGRTIRAPAFDGPAFLELPPRDQRAHKALLFDGEGNLIVGPTDPPPDAPVQVTLPFSGATPRDFTLKLADLVSVRDFGAAGDGLADDTGAFGSALAASDAVFVPAGTYRITGPIVLDYGKSLWGVGDGSVITAGQSPIVMVEMIASYASLHNLRLIGGTVGVKLYGKSSPCVQNAVHDLTIWDAGTGLVLDGYQRPDDPCYWNNFHNILIARPGVHGVHLMRSGAGDTPNANRFTKIRVYSLSAPFSGTGFYVEAGRFNNSFVDCEANLTPTGHSCFRCGPDTDKTLIVNLYTETLGGMPNVTLDEGSVETAIINLFSASAGPAIWDLSGGQYTAVNAGYPDKNKLQQTRINEVILERLRFDTEYLAPMAGGVVDLDLASSIYLVSSHAGALELRLPPAADVNGNQVTIKKIDVGSYPITVTEYGATGPDDRRVTLASKYDYVTVLSNGAAWHILSSNEMPVNAGFHEEPGLFVPDFTRRLYLVSALNGAVEVRLPAPAATHVIGRPATIKKTDVSAHTVSVTETGGPGPDNGTVVLTDRYELVTVLSNGAAWHVIGR
jgi:hypothetical protein